MEFDRPAQRFQEWIGRLDDDRIRAQVEAIELELQNLQMYRDLLNHALDLKQRSDAWFTSDAWESWVGVDDPPSIAARAVKGDTSASHDSGTRTDEPPFAPNSLAARLARERVEPRLRIGARDAGHPPRAVERSGELAESVEATRHSDPDNQSVRTGLPVRVWLDKLEKPDGSADSSEVSPEVSSLEPDGLKPDDEGAARVQERVQAETREPHSPVTDAPRGKLARLSPIAHRLLGSG